jgi:hypothetical protein
MTESTVCAPQGKNRNAPMTSIVTKQRTEHYLEKETNDN